jgi:hypothetical protein
MLYLEMSNYKCLICSKTFTSKYRLERHKLNKIPCKNKNNEKNELRDKILNCNNYDEFLILKNNLLEQNNEPDEIEENQNIITNDINEPLETVEIEVENKLPIPFGEENINDLNIDEYEKIVSNKKLCGSNIFEYLHFNKRLPQYHNIYLIKNTTNVLIYTGLNSNNSQIWKSYYWEEAIRKIIPNISVKLTKLFEHNNVSDIKIPNVNHDIILNTLRKYSDIVIKSRYKNDKY